MAGVLSSPNNSSILLLPDQYSSASPTDVAALVTSGQATLNLPPWLGSSLPQPGLVSGLPLSIIVLPGAALFPSAIYQGRGLSWSLSTTDNTTVAVQASAGSFLVSSDTYVVAIGSTSHPVIFYDSVPDVAQLPAGQLQPKDRQLTLVDMQSGMSTSSSKQPALMDPAPRYVLQSLFWLWALCGVRTVHLQAGLRRIRL